MFPHFDDVGDAHLLTTAMGASPGAAVGAVVFDSETAVREAARGRQVVLVRRETTPDDLAGMIAAQGILTSRGGKTSHAAVVARGMGKTCVCGAEELEVDVHERTLTTHDGTGRARGRRRVDRRHHRHRLPRRGGGDARARSCATSRGSRRSPTATSWCRRCAG
jgi:pyruvate,orthophosphate dikinase